MAGKRTPESQPQPSNAIFKGLVVVCFLMIEAHKINLGFLLNLALLKYHGNM